MKTHQFLLSFFLLVCSSAIASVLLAQDSKLPEKAKLETILYQDADMIGVGYVYKKQFVENQHVTFISKSFRDKHFSSYRIKEKNGQTYLHERKSNTWVDLSSLKPFISGIYFTRNDTSYIKGIVNPYDGFVCEGIFIFCNSKHNNKYFLSPLAKETQKFSLGMSGATSYQLTIKEGYKAYGKSLGDGYSLKNDDNLSVEGYIEKYSGGKYKVTSVKTESECTPQVIKVKSGNGCLLTFVIILLIILIIIMILNSVQVIVPLDATPEEVKEAFEKAFHLL